MGASIGQSSPRIGSQSWRQAQALTESHLTVKPLEIRKLDLSLQFDTELFRALIVAKKQAGKLFWRAMFSDLEVTAPWSYSLMVLGLYSCLLIKAWVSRSKVPMVGVQSRFELRLVSSFRFYTHAEAILLDGYTKVSQPFLVRDTRVNMNLVQG